MAVKAKLSSTKMTAMGEMAGGIAHEINNPVAIIRILAEQLQDILTEGTDVDAQLFMSHLEKIKLSADRISTIVKSLRMVARDGSKDPFQTVSIKTVVDDTLRLCRERFKKSNIEMRIKIKENIEFECRATQISQVLLNLLVNAFDAVENLKEKWIEIGAEPKGATLEITVTDSGKGILEKIREKIMDPFFTTKNLDKGTGLGLSVSKGVVESHHGTLELNSKHPNTRFVIRLPIKQKGDAIAA